MSEPPRRRPRHLMDPANPRPASTGQRGMSITTVQRWVMSTLAVTTVMHLVVGLLVAAAFLDTTRAGAREGLVVIAGLMGVLGVAAAFVIHQRSPAMPWALLGAMPAALGAFWVL